MKKTTLIDIIEAALKNIDLNSSKKEEDIEIKNNMIYDINENLEMNIDHFHVFYVKDLKNDYNLLENL